MFVVLGATGNTGAAAASTLLAQGKSGLNTGRVAWEAGHSIWRGETDIEAVFAPLLGSAK
jgi:hypothetical protein